MPVMGTECRESRTFVERAIICVIMVANVRCQHVKVIAIVRQLLVRE